MKMQNEAQRLPAEFRNVASLTYTGRESEVIVFQSDRIAFAEAPSFTVMFSPVWGASQKTIFIQDLNSDSLQLIQPLPVSIEFTPYNVTAFVDGLKEFTWATDEFSAVSEMKLAIVDLYSLLKKEREHLGVIPRRQWDLLQLYVRER